MAMYGPNSYFCTFQCLFLLVFGFTLIQNVCSSHYTLKVSNDGPAILDSTVTFTATIRGGSHDDEFKYFFEDNSGISDPILGGRNVTYRKKYPSYESAYDSLAYYPGIYSMEVIVERKKIFYIEVAREKTNFQLTSEINGNFSLSVGATDIIAINTTLNVTYDIHDPSGFFAEADIDYAWSINEHRWYGVSNFYSYNVTTEGTININAAVHARVPVNNHTESLNKWGFPKRQLKALRPVTNVTVSGNVFLKQGDVLYLDITCDGSEPFNYCSRIVSPDQSFPLMKNVTCDPVMYSQCSFHIQHYFPKAGKYAIGAIIGNRLGLEQHPILIEIYDVSKKAQLSTVIVPIAGSLIAMIIIVGGIAYHVHQRKAYVIEVADFDFQQPLPPQLNEKTFVERLKEAFKLTYANCQRNRTMEGGVGGVNDDVTVRRGGGGRKSLLLSPDYGATD